MDKKGIADRIFALLDQTDMEQQEFAKLVGVSDDTASNWRRYKSASFTNEKYFPKIAQLLETTEKYLLTGEDEKLSNDRVEQDDDPLWAVWHEKYKALTPRKRIEAYEKFVKDYSV